MPPKFLYTREEILRAALEVIREKGASGLTARALAARLGCSVKPIFGLFRNMEEVWQETIRAAGALYRERAARETAEHRYPPYKAAGMAYIRFAREERELFKLLYMRDRTGEDVQEDENTEELLALIRQSTGLDRETARLFHLEMWAYVHGIAAMIATGYLDWDMALISRSLTDCYTGLKTRFSGENGDGQSR